LIPPLGVLRVGFGRGEPAVLLEREVNMGTFRTPTHRRSLRRLGAIGTVLATAAFIVGLAAVPAVAATCVFDDPNNELEVTMAASESLTFTIGVGDDILVNGNDTNSDPCDTGQVLDSAEVDEIIITGTGGGDSVTISAAGAAAFDDDDDFTIDLEGGTDSLTMTGATGVDTITFTPIAFNGPTSQRPTPRRSSSTRGTEPTP
jgi:hypothetical protein